jgi:hypothetical protein
VVVDDDPDGRRHSEALAGRIHRIQERKIEVRLVIPNRWRETS